MKIAFSPLATVTPMHPYYSEGCRDFQFLPTSATADRLRAGRSIARVMDGSLYLLYETSAPNTPISSLAGTTLYFGLCLNNPYFSNFTSPVLADANKTPLYANTAAPTTLDAPLPAIVCAGFYSHTPSDANRPLDLILKTQSQQSIASVHLDIGQDAGSFDLRALSAGRYLLDENDSSILAVRNQLVVDPDLRDYGVWGVLALTIDASFYTNAPQLNINFTPRQETLRYYVVADNFATTDFNQLNVSDQGYTSDGRSQITFAKVLPPFPADCIDSSLLAGSGEQVALFQSQSQVARSQRGLHNLKLSRSTTSIIDNLPLPGPEKAQADLIVHLSKP